MPKVVAGMTMSLDGFVRDRSGRVDALYPDFDALHNTEPMKEAIRTTGAVVMGRRAFAMAEDPDWYAGNYEFQVPVFVLAHEVPQRQPRQTERLTFTFVTDGVESAVRQAKAAAGDRDVTVIGGASTVQQCLRAGLIDELDIDIMPVLLGGGLRLVEAGDIEPISLERLRVVALPGGRTHFRFRVVK